LQVSLSLTYPHEIARSHVTPHRFVWVFTNQAGRVIELRRQIRPLLHKNKKIWKKTLTMSLTGDL
jgi:hypothetical protein